MTPNPFENMSKEQLSVLMDNPQIDNVTKRQLHAVYTLSKFITVDARMAAVKKQILTLAPRNEPVLIYGETGTGKELIATALHGWREGKIIKVNCSGLPDELIESELFGHTQGAFTGAIRDRVGKLQAAKNGTIFLDEVGDMPMNMQAKLLRALQEKLITPLGSNEEVPINCRIVSATNKDLGKMQMEGKFRLDLLHRIATFTLHTIPLRMRQPDIHELMDSLFDKTNLIPPAIRDKISQLPLYGNVRELEAICLRYIVLGEFEQHEGGNLI